MQTEAFPSLICRPVLKDVVDVAAAELGEAVLEWLQNSGSTETELDDETIAVLRDAITSLKNGYEIAKELDAQCGYDPDVELVQILDDAHSIGVRHVVRAVKQWVVTANPQPKLSVGMTVTIPKSHNYVATIGVIDEIERTAAEYYVKMHPSDTTRRIFRWEQLEALNPTLLIDAESRS